MVAPQLVRRYARNQQIDLQIADLEIVLHYVLGLLNEVGLVGHNVDGEPGPLLFKGGTALRKCLFGSGGRFSQDIDLDASYADGFEAVVEQAFVDHNPFCGIEFSFAKTRWSEDRNENFSGTVAYNHQHRTGSFELQISYRLNPVLAPRDLPLLEQEYTNRVEFPAPVLYGLDPYEMIGEKIMACNRRQGGTAKDVYDLYLWASRPFDVQLVRRVAVLKAWTDQRATPRYDPETLLVKIRPDQFRWTDLDGLVPRNQYPERERICQQVRERFAFLTALDPQERQLLADQTAHREHSLYQQLAAEARARADHVVR